MTRSSQLPARGRAPGGWPCSRSAVGLAALPAGVGAAAPTTGEPKVRLDLVSEVRAVAPGAAFWVGAPPAHRPGLAHVLGQPRATPASRRRWTGRSRAGFDAGAIAWPYPARIPLNPRWATATRTRWCCPSGSRRPRGSSRHARHARGPGALGGVREDLHSRGGVRRAARCRWPPVRRAGPARRAADRRARARACRVPSPWPASLRATLTRRSRSPWPRPGSGPSASPRCGSTRSRWGAIDARGGRRRRR